LVDPRAEQADLFGRQARALARHNVVGVNSLHQGDDQTLGALAREDRRTAISPFEGGLPGVHAEPALVLAPAMAIDAACFEDGFDFPGETDGMTRRRRQLGGLLGSDRGLGSAATACPNNQPHVKKAVSHSARKIMVVSEKHSGNLL